MAAQGIENFRNLCSFSNECGLCLHNFGNDPSILKHNLPCGHKVHHKCLIQRLNPKCAICDCAQEETHQRRRNAYAQMQTEQQIRRENYDEKQVQLIQEYLMKMFTLEYDLHYQKEEKKKILDKNQMLDLYCTSILEKNMALTYDILSKLEQIRKLEKQIRYDKQKQEIKEFSELTMTEILQKINESMEEQLKRGNIEYFTSDSEDSAPPPDNAELIDQQTQIVCDSVLNNQIQNNAEKKAPIIKEQDDQSMISSIQSLITELNLHPKPQQTSPSSFPEQNQQNCQQNSNQEKNLENQNQSNQLSQQNQPASKSFHQRQNTFPEMNAQNNSNTKSLQFSQQTVKEQNKLQNQNQNFNNENQNLSNQQNYQQQQQQSYQQSNFQQQQQNYLQQQQNYLQQQQQNYLQQQQNYLQQQQNYLQQQQNQLQQYQQSYPQQQQQNYLQQQQNQQSCQQQQQYQQQTPQKQQQFQEQNQKRSIFDHDHSTFSNQQCFSNNNMNQININQNLNMNQNMNMVNQQ